MRKTVLITGASGGLGLEFARIYAREGFDLVVVARSEGKLYKLKSELETQYDCHVWVLAQDLSQPDAAYEVFNYTLEKNITIDALVNNAGFGDFGNFWEVDAQRQTDLLQVNIMTLVQLTRYFLPGMVERRHGSVLNLSSVAAFSAGPRMCLYLHLFDSVQSDLFTEDPADQVSGFLLCLALDKLKILAVLKVDVGLIDALCIVGNEAAFFLTEDLIEYRNGDKSAVD